MWKDDDPLIGQVHREKKSRTQHYLLSSINGIKYKLTGKFVVYRGEVHAELINEKGNTLWSNKDGDWIEYFDMKGQALHPWEEEINWDREPLPTDTEAELRSEHRRFKLALQEIAAMSGGVSRHNNMKSFPVVKHLVKRMGNTAAEAIGHKPVFEDLE